MVKKKKPLTFKNKKLGEKEGIKIWRIEKFEVKEIPKQNYGKFYDGDSYIILNTYLKEKKICWNIHFWLGKDSTQDEMVKQN